jgi:hypothetical protein
MAARMLFLVVFLMTPLLTQAQDDCPAVVADVYDMVETACSQAERGEACYGNTLIDAQPYSDVEDFWFSQPGDLAELAAVKTMRLSPLKTQTAEWGISLLYVDAVSSESTLPQAVQLIAFGNVEIENAADGLHNPMQAFYYRSQLDDRPCYAAPDSGILVQTPQGVGKITLLVNEVAIELGSTAYLQAQAGEEMLLTTLEGETVVSAVDDSVYTPQGARTRIPLTDQGLPESAPLAAEPFDPATLQNLPVQLLDRPIAITSDANGYTINFCRIHQPPLREGQTVFINYGIGRWVTPEEAAAVLEGHTASITLDGVPLDTNYDGILLHDQDGDPGYGKRALATWIATAGTHTMVGTWTLGSVTTCMFTVE